MRSRIKKEKFKQVKQSFDAALLVSYADEYKVLHEIWRNLDLKAQGTIAIAGIFIGGVFNYIRDIKPESFEYERNLLAFSVFCLVVCVVLAVWVLKIQEVTEPPIGKDLHDKIKDLLQNKDESDFQDHINIFPDNRFDEWSRAQKSITGLNKEKAKRLWWAHISLMAAILAVALLSILKL